MELFLTMADKLGVPAAILVAVIYGVWKIVKWTGHNVILPITKKHIELIDESKAANKTNAETLVKMANISEVTGQALVRIADQHEEGVKLTREIHAAIVKKQETIQLRTRDQK